MSENVLEIHTHYLDPVRAEVRLRVPWPLEAGSELRGRLMGPRCPFASTVEVAYPWRPAASAGALRTIIPEPSLWEPECPFLYEGPVESWTGGKLDRQAWVSHGLRTLAWGPRDLLLNGRPYRLRGLEVNNTSEADLLRLRQKGYNALLTRTSTGDIRSLADRLGFLVLTRATSSEDLDDRQTASHLGWIVDEGFLRQAPTLERRAGRILGLSLDDLPHQRLPDYVSILLVPRRLAEELRPLGLPMLVWQQTEGRDFASAD